jgi:anti-sigma B factor antagonist
VTNPLDFPDFARFQGETTMDQITSPPDATSNLPTLEFEGEMDLAVATPLHEKLDALFDDGATSIVVDLLNATFIDSTALGVLVTALNRCQERGGQLHLVVTEPQILRVLTITGLTDAFTLHESRHELHNEMGGM